MKIHILIFLFIISVTTLTQAQSTRYISLVEYEKKSISMTDENGNVTSKSLRDLDEELEHGLALYYAGNFSEAYPIISELSQWGLKNAQFILGLMFIRGEHVEKSIERGLEWLGVAKEGHSQKVSRDSFNYIYEQLTSEQKELMDQKIADHIEKFGTKAQHVVCNDLLP